METTRKLLIGIVGPCASGKSTLVNRLTARGMNVRHIAQEHSYVPTMWKKITNPDILIYLMVSYPLTIARNQLDWTLAEYNEQLHRLRHAHEHAHLVIETDDLSQEDVENKVLAFFAQLSVS
jgi:uridine kinase